MARYWDDKDAHGKPLTDGRVCLVIESEDPSMPPIRTYGRDKDEVLDKLARTTETAQTEIHRLRTKNPPTPTTTTAAPAPAGRLTADEQARATADLSNPAKSPEAIETLLRGVGIDVRKLRMDEDAKRVRAIAAEWQRNHPEFPYAPHDERNGFMLIDRAALMVGFTNITAEALDRAYEHLSRHDLLFELRPAQPETTVHPDGNRETRTDVVLATSQRRHALRGTAPVVAAPKPKWNIADIDKLNSKQLRDKIENEPGFRQWYDSTFAAKTA